MHLVEQRMVYLKSRFGKSLVETGNHNCFLDRPTMHREFLWCVCSFFNKCI